MREKHPAFALSVCALALTLCTGCGATNAPSQPAQQDASSVESADQAAPSEAAGYDILGGDWEVSAITYKDKIVSVDAVDALADLYDNVFLGFSKDGTFEYRKSVFVTRGHYEPHDTLDGVFVLKADTISRATIEDGKITETEGEDSDKAYYVATSDEVENALGFVEMDTSTGKTKSGSSPIYFKKRGTSSSSDNTKDDGASSKDKDSSSSSSGSKPMSGYRSEGVSGSSSGSSSSGGSSSSTYATGNQKAKERAQQYLQTTAFSHDGLVEQLEFEGFSHEDATYGADACGADWMEQAVLKAKQYLQTTAFSESGLVQQLEYEGFTHAEAEHGVSLCGADWMEQAVKKARQYQGLSAMSRSRLIEQLEYEGFTHQQAVHGADGA